MRIIKPAKTTPTMQFSCNKCEAKLEAEKGDPFRYESDRRGGQDDACVFKCASCGADIWVAASLVPKDWR